MVISLLICPNIYRVPRGILSMRMNTMAEGKPIYLKCLYNSRSLEWLTIKRVLQFFTQFPPSFHAVPNNCLVYVEFAGVFFRGNIRFNNIILPLYIMFYSKI